MEIRLNIDDEFIRRLQEDLREGRATEIAREALGLLRWAVDERQRNRVILSANPDGTNLNRLSMPILEKVAPA